MPPVRIAMWSGPRNISTAMMRAWESRPDTIVCDEPLYGHYLKATGVPHPMAEQIIADMDCDGQSVTAALTGPIKDGARIYYQKHMTHHLLDSINRDWMDHTINCFLIRDPVEVIASYAVKRDHITLEDIGMVQQAEIYDYVHSHTGCRPLVLDSGDVLRNPEAMLDAFCDAVGVSFDPAMLQWPAGRRASDGIWAAHWYHNVEASTGFAPYSSKQKTTLSPSQETLAIACAPHYQRLFQYRLQVSSDIRFR